MLHRWIAAALAAAFSLAALDAAGAAPTIADSPHKPAAKHRKHAPPAHDPLADRYIDIAGFGDVAIYRPKVASKDLALFASGDGGWNLGVLDMAHEAAAAGFWVAGFNTPKFLKALDEGDAECSDADGLIAKLGATLVQTLGLPLGTKPVVIGYSSGATVVYAALAADAGRRLGGGISLGFCPDLLIKKPFCRRKGRPHAAQAAGCAVRLCIRQARNRRRALAHSAGRVGRGLRSEVRARIRRGSSRREGGAAAESRARVRCAEELDGAVSRVSRRAGRRASLTQSASSTPPTFVIPAKARIHPAFAPMHQSKIKMDPGFRRDGGSGP